MIHIPESIRLEKEDIIILDDALKTYISELDYIRHMCKHPVYVGKEPIENVISRSLAIKKVIHEVRNGLG